MDHITSSYWCHIGPFKKLQAFTYRKVGAFLEEYKSATPTGRPNAVYDLSIMNVVKVPKSKKFPYDAFALQPRQSSPALTLIAPNATVCNEWAEAINADYEAYGAGRRKDNCPAALIAPIRRRHMSLLRTKSNGTIREDAASLFRERQPAYAQPCRSGAVSVSRVLTGIDLSARLLRHVLQGARRQHALQRALPDHWHPAPARDGRCACALVRDHDHATCGVTCGG